MHLKTIIIVLSHFTLMWTNVACRGPHHPRGDSISKHHVHYKPTKGRDLEEQNIIQDSELLHDKEHLEEHLDEIIDTPNLDNLTDEELDFYYFQVHDVDRNNKLDGLEILQAIQHTHHEHDHKDENEADQENEMDQKTLAEEVQASLEYYTELIDKVFAEDDLDDDGYLSYVEYKAGREKEGKIPGRKLSSPQSNSNSQTSDEVPSVQLS